MARTAFIRWLFRRQWCWHWHSDVPPAETGLRLTIVPLVIFDVVYLPAVANSFSFAFGAGNEFAAVYDGTRHYCHPGSVAAGEPLIRPQIKC